MARLISTRDPTLASLDECVEELVSWGFDPGEEGSLSHAANWLKRLGNDPHFLGDVLVDMLAGTGPAASNLSTRLGIGSNRILLAAPRDGNFLLTADIWPSATDPAFRASGPQALGYGIVHDHSHDFVTLGYLGPGRETEEYEYDYEAVTGYPGEPVMLHPFGRSRLEPGTLVHYRARRDVHCHHPPEELSVSLTLTQVHGAQSWLDHYTFEQSKGHAGAFRIARALGGGPSATLLRLAVALGGAEAAELARSFGDGHPSDRMRLAAWSALAAATTGDESREAIWREAEQSGSRLVAAIARRVRQRSR